MFSFFLRPRRKINRKTHNPFPSPPPLPHGKPLHTTPFLLQKNMQTCFIPFRVDYLPAHVADFISLLLRLGTCPLFLPASSLHLYRSFFVVGSIGFSFFFFSPVDQLHKGRFFIFFFLVSNQIITITCNGQFTHLPPPISVAIAKDVRWSWVNRNILFFFCFALWMTNTLSFPLFDM